MSAFMKLMRDHWFEVFFAVVAVIGINAFLLIEPYRGDYIDAAKAAQFGEFIGGYIGTLFLAISVAVVFGSFRNQRTTNSRIIFENRFFELLKYHRENVEEMGIGEKNGRRIFVSMIREFRMALRAVNSACEKWATEYPQDKRLCLAYMAFYYGVGWNSTRVFKESVKDEHPQNLVDELVRRMVELQEDYRSWASKKDPNDPSSLVSNANDKGGEFGYCPFDGHQSRLGHYYRHLYQLVKYADQRAPDNLAREYVDLVRAQLTNHEQALLCLNSLSKIGGNWLRNGYLRKFEMIKNIPKDFFNSKTEVDLEEKFSSIRFEYLEPKFAEPNREIS